jgi:hypothetical protein
LLPPGLADTDVPCTLVLTGDEVSEEANIASCPDIGAAIDPNPLPPIQVPSGANDPPWFKMLSMFKDINLGGKELLQGSGVPPCRSRVHKLPDGWDNQVSSFQAVQSCTAEIDQFTWYRGAVLNSPAETDLTRVSLGSGNWNDVPSSVQTWNA